MFVFAFASCVFTVCCELLILVFFPSLLNGLCFCLIFCCEMIPPLAQKEIYQFAALWILGFLCALLFLVLDGYPCGTLVMVVVVVVEE